MQRDRVEYAAIAVCRLLHERGIEALTIRAIAHEVGCSPSTLVHRFRTRRSMLCHVARYVGDLWLDGLHNWAADPLQLLPVDELTLWHTRCWLAMEELARNDPALALVAVDVRAREEQLIARHTGDLDAPVLAHLRAVLDGLRSQVTSPERGMSLAAARGVLSRHLDAAAVR